MNDAEPLAPLEASSAERIIFEAKSVQGRVCVTEHDGRRYLLLGKDGEQQSAYDPRWPEDTIFEYPRLMTPALALKPDTRNLLLIGLGGGTLPRLFKNYRPDIHVTVVELDPVVVRVAGEYFDFQAGDSVELVEHDGREFLERQNTRYDQIWLDAYGGSYIPEHLLSLEFLALCRNRLKPQGVLVQNVHCTHPLYLAQQATLTEAFGAFFLVQGKVDDNAAMIAQKGVTRPRSAKHAFTEGLKIIGSRFGGVNLPTEIAKARLASHTDHLAIIYDQP